MRILQRKSTFMAASIPLALLAAFFLPTAASGHCGGKHTGNHPHCGGGSNGSVQLGSGDDFWPGLNDDNSGDDTVYGGDGSDTIYGGDGNDTLDGQAGDDYLYGENGDDELRGGDGFDELYGGPGADHLRVDMSGLIIDGAEQVDYADGGSSNQENGKPHRDFIFLSHLASIDVTFDVPAGAVGVYTGTYSSGGNKNGKGRGGSPVNIKGEFRNIELMFATDGDDNIIGNDLGNEVWAYEGINTMLGNGGSDSFRGGYGDNGGYDVFDGGDGNDSFTGLGGNDFFTGGEGVDRLWTRENHGHDVMYDFVSGEDNIAIYNSNVCFPDLRITVVDGDLDGMFDDTRVEWGSNNDEASVTLLDTPGLIMTEADFRLSIDNPNYSGCP